MLVFRGVLFFSFKIPIQQKQPKVDIAASQKENRFFEGDIDIDYRGLWLSDILTYLVYHAKLLSQFVLLILRVVIIAQDLDK